MLHRTKNTCSAEAEVQQFLRSLKLCAPDHVRNTQPQSVKRVQKRNVHGTLTGYPLHAPLVKSNMFLYRTAGAVRSSRFVSQTGTATALMAS